VERGRAACYLGLVTVRHAALSIGAVLVLGLGVYLFIEVRAARAPDLAGPPATERDRTGSPERPPPERVTDRAAERSPDRPAGAPATRTVAAPPRSASPAAAPAAPAANDPAAAALDADALVGPKLDAAMDEANRAYDRGDFDDAKIIAGRVLARQPGNVRMLRVMVSASCIDGDSATAQAHFAKLPPADQVQMRTRCARYGIAFPDKP
jgi:hypothetical protein